MTDTKKDPRPMTDGEIVAEYKQAKSPMKQISILADQNVCSREEIIEVLRQANVELPKIYRKEAKPQAEKAPEIPKAAPAPKAYALEELKAIALDLIGELVLAEASDYFAEQVRGIFQLIKEVEKREERN